VETSLAVLGTLKAQMLSLCSRFSPSLPDQILKHLSPVVSCSFVDSCIPTASTAYTPVRPFFQLAPTDIDHDSTSGENCLSRNRECPSLWSISCAADVKMELFAVHSRFRRSAR
jgi:hypothetical protein